VATDVAARGIDVQDIARVIHVDPPDDADSYIHRSGRTGRAGRKGQSSVLVSPSALGRTTALLKRARVSFRIEPIPSAEDIRRTADERIYDALTADDPEGFAGYDQRLWSLAKRLASGEKVSRTIARLLDKTHHAGPTQPREIRGFAPRSEKTHERHAAPAPRSEAPNGGAFVPFRVSWGGEQGADARRVLAMVCRRGGIRGADVGNIRIARGFSIVDVASAVADAFAEASAQPDPRNPRVHIKRDTKPPVREAHPKHHPAAKRKRRDR
jgi:ATP-dependent RNA helicase DeaD